MEDRLSKALKIILILSLLPAAGILLYAVYAIFFEVPVLFGYSSGPGAFKDVIIVYTAALCIVPVLPVCLVYQLVYLLRKKSPHFNGMSGKKFFAIFGTASAVVIAAALFPMLRYNVSSLFEKRAAASMYRRCDEKIDYNTYTEYMGGVFGITGQHYACIMVDNSRHIVGFIPGDLPVNDYYEIKLKDSTRNAGEFDRICSGYFIQNIFPLEHGRLITFYSEKERSNLTSAIILEYDDGSVYFGLPAKDKEKEWWLGISSTKYFYDNQVRYADINTVPQDSV